MQIFKPVFPQLIMGLFLKRQKASNSNRKPKSYSHTKKATLQTTFKKFATCKPCPKDNFGRAAPWDSKAHSHKSTERVRLGGGPRCPPQAHGRGRQEAAELTLHLSHYSVFSNPLPAPCVIPQLSSPLWFSLPFLPVCLLSPSLPPPPAPLSQSLAPFQERHRVFCLSSGQQLHRTAAWQGKHSTVRSCSEQAWNPAPQKIPTGCKQVNKIYSFFYDPVTHQWNTKPVQREQNQLKATNSLYFCPLINYSSWASLKREGLHLKDGDTEAEEDHKSALWVIFWGTSSARNTAKQCLWSQTPRSCRATINEQFWTYSLGSKNRCQHHWHQIGDYTGQIVLSNVHFCVSRFSIFS